MIIPEGFGQATLVFGGSALPRGAAVVFGYDSSLSTSPNADADAIVTAVEDNLMGWLATNVTLVRVDTKWGPNSTGAIGSSASGTPGVAGVNSSPPNTSFLLRKLTDAGGRINQGRMYVPGVVEDRVGNDGVLTAGTVSGLQADATAFLNDLGAADLPMYLLHNDPGDSPTLVTGLLVEATVATQRHRLRR
jgi:hypothetical protein